MVIFQFPKMKKDLKELMVLKSIEEIHKEIVKEILLFEKKETV